MHNKIFIVQCFHNVYWLCCHGVFLNILENLDEESSGCVCLCVYMCKHTSAFTMILTDEGLGKANKRNGAILVLSVPQCIQHLPHILSTVINATLKRGRDGCC